MLVRHKSCSFDIIHAQYGSACAVATAAARGVPKVLSLRGNDWSVYSGKYNFHYLHSRLARLMTKSVLKDFEAVITVSKRMLREVQRYYPNAEVHYIPSPVDLERFTPLDKQQARKMLGYNNSNEKWILFTTLSKTDPVKRLSLAQDAFSKANQRMGNLRLRIANGIDHKQMPVFVASCDMILCTSETEGWPNSVKEALACNIPFVSTDVSDLAEISEQEPSCRICSPNADAIAENICDVLSEMQQTDLRRHVQEMSLPVISDKIVHLYKSIKTPC